METPCTILGIETSCDETSAAIVVDGLEMHPKVTIGTTNYPEENLSSDEILGLTDRIPYER